MDYKVWLLHLRYILVAPCILFSNPSDVQIANGNAQFLQDGSLLQIESGDRTILNWKDFSIDKGEITRFLLPGKDAAVLNRVVGGEISKIYGRLESNGKVYLLNPSGILIGESGIIDVRGGFAAATLDLSDADFLNGRDDLFTGDSSGLISNRGLIRAEEGEIFLIAAKIENFGTLQGENVLCRALGNPYELAIQCEGDVQATKIEQRDGRILLVADVGGTSFNGTAQAGRVEILGDDVIVGSRGKVDAGEVYIGGGFKGSDPKMQNALRAYVAEGARIDVSARGADDAGSVVVWGDEISLFQGTILATAEEGTGGFVEISSKDKLIPLGSIDTSSRAGKSGTLLFDPATVTIKSNGGVDSANVTFPPAATPTPGACPGFANPLTYAFSAGAETIDSARLAAFLGCNDVVINANLGTAGGAGDIFVLNNVVWNSAHSLTLIAAQDACFKANVQNSGAGGVTVTAARNVLVGTDNTPSLAAQAVMVGSQGGPISVTATGGQVIVGNAGSHFSSQIGFNLASAGISSNITVNANTGIQVLGGTSAGAYSQIGHGGSGVQITGAVASAVALTMTGVGDLVVTGGTNNECQAQVGHGGNFTPVQAGLGSVTGNMSVVFNGAGNAILTGGSAPSNVTGGAYAMIGHGGDEIFTGPITSDISLTLPSGNVNLKANTVIGGQDGYVAIGHNGIAGGNSGAPFANGGWQGNITLTLNNGNLALNPNAGDGTGTRCYTQIGHGGDAARPEFIAGTITIGVAGASPNGNIVIRGGDNANSVTDCYSQIGHGGVFLEIGSSTAPVGPQTGSITGDIDITASQNITMTGGGSANTGNLDYAQIGHIGSQPLFEFGTPTATGAINITTNNGSLNLTGGSGNVACQAQIGHGGNLVVGTGGTIKGTMSGDVNIMVPNGTITLNGGGNGTTTTRQNNIALIGHLGFNGVFPQVLGTVTNSNMTIVSQGDVSLLGSAAGNQCGAFIQEGGGNINLTVNTGNLILTGNVADDSATEITSSGDQTINVLQGVMTLTEGAGNTCQSAIISFNGSQFITVHGDINLHATSDGVSGFTQLGTYSPTNVTQNVISQTGSILLDSLDVAMGTNQTSGAILNENGTQFVQAAGDISVLATNYGINSNFIIFGGTVSQTVIAQTGNIKVIAGAADSSPASIQGNNSQVVNANGGFIQITAGAGAGSNAIIAAAADQTVTATGTITVLGGPGTGSLAQISAGNNQIVASSAAILVQGGIGDSSTAAISTSATTGGQTVTAGSNITVLAGDGNFAFGFIETATGVQSISAGGTLLVRGGTGPNPSIAYIANDDPNFTTFLATGGDIIFQNGLTFPGQGAFLQSSTGALATLNLLQPAAKRVIDSYLVDYCAYLAGGGALPFLSIGANPSFLLDVELAAPYAAYEAMFGPTPFLTWLFTVPPPNGVLPAPSRGPGIVTNPTYAGVSATAGGNIILCSDVVTDPQTEANLINLSNCTAQSLDFFADTPADGSGAFQVDTSLHDNLGNVVGTPIPNHGIRLSTLTGEIHVHSSDVFANGTAADVLLTNVNDLSLLPTLNLLPTQITSYSGNITVDPFRNVFINGPIITLGNITILADNNMELFPPAFLMSANTTLVVDEQGPNGQIGGVWNANGGSFNLDLGAEIIGTSTLRVFTAVRPNNAILGLLALNGVPFAPGTLFVDTGTEHWCTYFGGPGNAFIGPDYIIFYKNCLGAAAEVQTLTLASSQLFVLLNPYDEILRWYIDFTEKYRYDFLQDEHYFIGRRLYGEQHNPKTDQVHK